MEEIAIPVAVEDNWARAEAAGANNEAEVARAEAVAATEAAVEAVEAVEELKEEVQAIQEDQSWHAAMELRIAALERKISEASGMLEVLVLKEREPEAAAPEPEEPGEVEPEEIEVVEDRVPTPPPPHVQRRLNRSRKLF